MTSHHSLPLARTVPASLLLAGMLCLAAPPARAQQAFPSPDEAASALASAVKSGARRDMLRVLGSDGEDIISSGDAVSDAESRARFTSAYDAKHSVKVDGDKKAVAAKKPEAAPAPKTTVKKPKKIVKDDGGGEKKE